MQPLLFFILLLFLKISMGKFSLEHGDDIPDWTTNPVQRNRRSEDYCAICFNGPPKCARIVIPAPIACAHQDFAHSKLQRLVIKKRQLGSAVIKVKNFIIMELPLLGFILHMTPNGSLRLIETKQETMVSINSSHTRSALYHVCGQLYQNGEEVHVEVYSKDNHKYAKLSSSEIRFKSQKNALTFSINKTGTKSGSGSFLNLYDKNYTADIFSSDLNSFKYSSQQCSAIVESAINGTKNKTEYWQFDNNVKITRQEDGTVRVLKDKVELKVSTNAKACVVLPELRMTASCTEEEKHMFVKFKESRMYFNGLTFELRYLAQSAGFDKNNDLKLF